MRVLEWLLLGNLLLLAPLLVSSQAAVPVSVPVSVSVSEKDLLIQFYEATNGDNWKDHTDWKNENTPLCSWYGVYCRDGAEQDNEGVTRIDLSNNNVNGKIPPDFWKLPYLIHVNLRRNLLTDASLVGLRSSPSSPIEILILSENHITTLDGIGSAAATLQTINVNKNQIDTELTDELFDLTNLETMYIAFNQIPGRLPTLIGRLTKLTELYSFNNRMTGNIPSELGRLDSCQILGLGNNMFTGTVPTEINQMINLRDLSMHHVVNNNNVNLNNAPLTPSLTGPLPTFGDMPFLALLFLDGNSFSGTVPSDFLRHNNNINQPISVGLSHNNLTGTLPKTLERFDSLSIDLVGNPIEAIPPELCIKGGWMGGLVEEYNCDAILCQRGTYSLQGRAAGEKSLCLPCPDSYPYLGATSCTSDASEQDPWKLLAGFYLSLAGEKWTVRDGWEIFDNLVTGGTTDDLEHLGIDICDGWYGILCDEGDANQNNRHVTSISLPSNELFGTVPGLIFSLPHLQVFDLSNNNVEMDSLRAASRAEGLKSLILSNIKIQSLDGINEISTNLEQLYLDGLNIPEALPDELFALTNLKILHLQHGHFTGSIPTKIGLLTNLAWLNVYGNALAGTLPTELGTLTLIHSLDLSENQFVGSLPTELNLLTALINFAIHQQQTTTTDGNKLTGKIIAFDGLSKLNELNLEFNNFTGPIPVNFLQGITDKSAALSIELGHNQLSGSIPETLDQFDRLNLKLEGNQITGIPSRLCDHGDWMQGEVGQLADELKCNAILCPPGTWNEFGKETAESNCTTCSLNTNLYGQVECGDAKKTRESVILDKLFSETGGRYWTSSHDNWLKPGVPICKREGVICFNENDNEGVREIRMNGFGMRGTIPNDIWELTHARQLAFTENAVDVSFEGIEKADSLIVLKLSKCHLRTLSGLGKAPAPLKELHVAQNQFNGTIPEDIFELDQVQLIFLNNNHFSSRIPTLIGKMTGLTALELWNNRLTGPLPSEIGELTNLATLSVSENELSGVIASEIQGLETLAKLEIAKQRGNKFEGPFPAFDQNPNLVNIDASDNAFSGWLPPTFLSRVETEQKIIVDLSNNGFEGSFPESWSRLASLNIDLSDNMMSGLPASLCNNNGWNNGLVGLLGTCHAILCPPGTHLPTGRQTEPTEPCLSCPGGQESAPYFGSRECLDPRLLAEKEILTKFYAASNGTNWLIQTNWLSENPTCTWYGVTCAEDGYIEEVSLENNFVKSPSSRNSAVSIIFSLDGLKVLDLKGNRVELDFRQIPEASKVEFLRLSGTGLRSLDGISRAVELKALHVTNNEIRSVPDELYGMSNLESLFLSFNSITGTLSRKLGGLASLRELYVFGNHLTGTIPPQIGLMKSLTDFVAANNFLSGEIPKEFSSLSKLEQLSVYEQEGLELITGPVPSFSGAPNLWYFDASDNDLTGPLPDNFLINSAYTNQSVTIYLQNNDIRGTVPKGLAKFDVLDINLAGNRIVAIPEDLCTIEGWMQGNSKLVGNCSAILCPRGEFNRFGRQSPGNPCLPCTHLDSIEFLGHTHCENFTSERDTLDKLYDATGGAFWNFSKSWKSEAPICSWSGIFCEDGDRQDTQGVTKIMLNDNDLSGNLPSEVWTLPALRYLSAKGNPNLIVNFDGLANSAETLEVLYLSGVKMSTLDGISAGTSLRELHLTGNELKGTFPEEIFGLSKTLESLYVAYNLFYGLLPTRLGEMTKLQSFFAFGNDFLSTIPSELGRLQDLRILVLAENLLYGQIPHELSTMPSLQVFAAFRREKSGPRLSGSLPSFNKVPQLTDMYLQGNEIQGSIPNDFVSASMSVEIIRLSSNLLTGGVPANLAVIPKLTLELEGNEIEGFPNVICDMKEWMDGAIDSFGCDGFLCPPGSSSPVGRAANATALCDKCTRKGVSPYYGSTSCDGPPNQREILVNLFYALDGDSWYRQDFWGSTADVCDWYGIGCIADKVVEINLRGNNLQGIPGPDLFYLPELQILWLYSNPIEFSFENIGSAKKLQDLRLDSTKLHSLHGIGSASSLVSFDSRFTSLRGSFPDEELLRLSNLRSLSLGVNSLTGTLPKSFAGLKYLVNLRLDSNLFTGRLPAFDDMHFLKYVDCSDNALTGIISRKFLDKLDTQITPTVKIARNQLTGVVPEEFDRFDEMILYLSDNKILGLPLTLCDNDDWNSGDVGNFGCDAIMCKPGTFNEHGRRRATSKCRPCASATYYGETMCLDGSTAPPAIRTFFGTWLSLVFAFCFFA